jgi:hypothetical protein
LSSKLAFRCKGYKRNIAYKKEGCLINPLVGTVGFEPTTLCL